MGCLAPPRLHWGNNHYEYQNQPIRSGVDVFIQGHDPEDFRLNRLAETGVANLDKLPISIKVMLESCLRNLDNFIVSEGDVTRLANWNAPKPENVEVPFKVAARVVLQDFTGVTVR